VYFTLPDGRKACANWDDEPVVSIMRRSRGDDRKPADVEAISQWLDKHAEQSAACGGGTCGHS